MIKEIAFVTEKHNKSTGSYRIWISDLNHYFNQIEDEVEKIISLSLITISEDLKKSVE